jgi:Mg-chelatase subunit ChlD
MNGEPERLRRWRLVLGGEDAAEGTGLRLGDADGAMDRALAALYGGGGEGDSRQGGLGASAPRVARWLGDIRGYFPSSVVRVMQQDAFERLGLKQMLLQPEMLQAVEADVHLVATLLSLRSVMPESAREAARDVVRKVVREVERRLAEPLRQAVTGSLSRSVRNRRPRHAEIDWNRTIRANLRHYQPEYQTIVPETRIGYGRRRQSMRHVILCIDQSGSMAASVVYSAIFGAVLATLPAVSTSLVVFDTSIVDLTEELDDPIDLLFSTRLGGGTDINRAVGYCQQLVRSPHETIFVLISDLYEGGVEAEFMKRAATLVASGVQFVTLLALSDEGAPSYNADLAAQLATLGVPAFACTPDRFPELMAAAIQRADLRDFVAKQWGHV